MEKYPVRCTKHGIHMITDVVISDTTVCADYAKIVWFLRDSFGELGEEDESLWQDVLYEMEGIQLFVRNGKFRETWISGERDY